MSNRGAAPGERRGGRQKGTPNKKTQAIEAMLEHYGCEPLEVLAMVASGKPLTARIGVAELEDDFLEGPVLPTLDQRIAAAKELCQYVYPKRKAIEHSGGINLHEASLDELA